MLRPSFWPMSFQTFLWHRLRFPASSSSISSPVFSGSFLPLPPYPCSRGFHARLYPALGSDLRLLPICSGGWCAWTFLLLGQCEPVKACLCTPHRFGERGFRQLVLDYQHAVGPWKLR